MDDLITLRAVSLRTVERLLVPVGEGILLSSDRLNYNLALRDACEERGWIIPVRSAVMASRVTGESRPLEVVKTSGGGLLGVWVA